VNLCSSSSAINILRGLYVDIRT